MRSRNSIRWLLFVLATSASAAVFADHSLGDADAGAKAGVSLDADVGASGNIEGAAIQGMTGAEAEASGDVNANTGDRPRGAVTRAREKVRNLFRGRGNSSVSGSTEGEISGWYSVGPFGPRSID